MAEGEVLEEVGVESSRVCPGTGEPQTKGDFGVVKE